jgi:hypothetical protein
MKVFEFRTIPNENPNTSAATRTRGRMVSFLNRYEKGITEDVDTKVATTEAGITFIATTLLMFTYFILIVLSLLAKEVIMPSFPSTTKRKIFLASRLIPVTIKITHIFLRFFFSLFLRK